MRTRPEKRRRVFAFSFSFFSLTLSSCFSFLLISSARAERAWQRRRRQPRQLRASPPRGEVRSLWSAAGCGHSSAAQAPRGPGGGSRLSPLGVVRLVLLYLPASCPLPPITAVRKGCGQLSCDGHRLVSQPRAEPSLSPPLGGSSASNIHHVNS